MAGKTKSRARSTGSTQDPSKAMRDSAQKIWLAGLGAFERAKSEGPKMFETLVRQGRDLGGRAREAADQAMKSAREQANEAGGKWDKLEKVVEDRVSRSLSRLGVLSSREMTELSRQVEELNENVRNLMEGRAEKAAGPGKRTAASRKKPATTKKPGAQKAATRRAKARRKAGAR